MPVFAAAAGGIEEYLKDGVNGFQIRMDAEDIASKLATAFADPALMSRLREGAIATARSTPPRPPVPDSGLADQATQAAASSPAAPAGRACRPILTGGSP